MISNEGISKWFKLSELNTLEMPFTAKFVIKHYLNFAVQDNLVYGGIADGNQVIFTKMTAF